MKVSSLLQGIEYTGELYDCDITNVSCDSRKLTPTSAFVCVKGTVSDGHDYVNSALSKGVQCIVCERDLGIKNQILVKNSHYAYAKMCANIMGNPAQKLKFIGVTGTNGKTTVTTLIKKILTDAGLKVGLIGTIQNEIGSTGIYTEKTTPNAMDYQELLSRMVKAECDYAVLEVSSHALDQCRLADTQFEVGVFTNLSQDHLDYHSTMENYFNAKKKMFDYCAHAVINIDDPKGVQLTQSVPCSFSTFSVENDQADYCSGDIEMNAAGVKFYIKNDGIMWKVYFATPGIFSIKNVLAAAAACKQVGIPVETIVESINSCKLVKGRSEIIPTGRDFTIICDYAHTPDGLENIISSINQFKKGRTVTLFGCGGDRDKKKRPLMGEVCARESDFLIITSDNPRSEDPDSIIDDIMPGVEAYDTPYVRITDRRQAIHYAVEHAQPHDVILLAGKGHEDYQVIGTQKIHFDEREIVAEALEKTKD